jgi:AcrR family transcriptional regulator
MRTGVQSFTQIPEAEMGLRSRLPRDEQKSRTRRKLLESTLELMADGRGFSSVSLREVTREARVVPTAFYRHFSGMEPLGLALVDESFTTLRGLMREARERSLPPTHMIRRSVETFLGHARSHRPHFQFIAKERNGGSTTLRFAIRKEIALFVSELSTDLARFVPAVSTEDLQMMAALIVQTVIAATELVLDLPRGEDGEVKRIYRTCEKQLRLIVMGALQWKSKP